MVTLAIGLVVGYVIGQFFPFYWAVERLFPFLPLRDLHEPPQPTKVTRESIEVVEKVGHVSYRARVRYSDGKTRYVRGSIYGWQYEDTGDAVDMFSAFDTHLDDALARYKLQQEMENNPGRDS